MSGTLGEHHNGSFKTYFSHKIEKLSKQNSPLLQESISDIFKGCSIFVNGFTQPPLQEIRRLTLLHGGIFNSYQVSSTTHFICDYLPRAKIIQLENMRKLSLYYVTTSWFVQSIKENKRLPEVEHLPPGLPIRFGRGPMIFSNSTNSANTIDFEGNAQIESINQQERMIQRNSDDISLKFHANGENVMDNLDPFPNIEDSASSTLQISTKISSPAQSRQHAGLRSTEDNPEFLKHYFQSSRLHFLGAWKTKLPALTRRLKKELYIPNNINMSELRPENNKYSSLPASTQRVILHVDMDCFFVSALLRNRL